MTKVKQLAVKIFSVRELALLLVVIFTGFILSLVSPYFLSKANINSLVISFSYEAIVLDAMTILIVSGGFDLSVGSLVALCGVVAGLGMKLSGSIFLGVFFALLVGLICASINGVVVTKAKVNPLIVTLGMMTIARGLALVITQGYSVTNLPANFAFLGQGVVLGIPVPVTIMLVIVILGDVCLRKNRFLRQVYYIGGNEKAASLSGIRVDQMRIFTYLLTGFAAALAGIILASRLMVGTQTAGTGLELRVISAVVIGGASLSGGEGTVLGAFLGMIFMALIGNALTLLNVSLYWHGVVTGAILILAVSLDMLVKRRRKK